MNDVVKDRRDRTDDTPAQDKDLLQKGEEKEKGICPFTI